MAWVEVEEELGPWMLLFGYADFAAGLAVWIWYDLVTALVVYLGVLFSVSMLRGLYLQLHLPRAARLAAQRALDFFREQFPEERVKSVAVRAIEAERIVVSVRYGLGYPTPRRYFAVSLPDLEEIVELDRAAWWPRGLK
jgi:hypothetical protein